MPKYVLMEKGVPYLTLTADTLESPITEVVAEKGSEWTQEYVQEMLDFDPKTNVRLVSGRLSNYDASEDGIEVIDTKDAPVGKGDTLTALIARVRSKHAEPVGRRAVQRRSRRAARRRLP